MTSTCPTAVVLGASTGTGAAIAKHLAWRGLRVIGLHRGKHREEAETVARAGGGDLITMIEVDAGTSVIAVEGALAAVATALRGTSTVSVLVHSLSGAAVGTTLGMTPPQVERTFATQAHSFLWWAQGLRRNHLLAPHATLIALTNPVATNYLWGSGVIGPAKAALEAYVRSLAVELGQEGHRVFGINFGAVSTPALDKVIPGALDRMQKVHQSISPARRMQDASEIANLVALLTEHAGITAALNGAIIDYNFGATLMLMDYAFSKK